MLNFSSVLLDLQKQYLIDTRDMDRGLISKLGMGEGKALRECDGW